MNLRMWIAVGLVIACAPAGAQAASGPPGTWAVIAGTGQQGLPTPGPATSSALWGPVGVTVDPQGNVYIADEFNNAVEEVTPAGMLSVIAGVPGQTGRPTPGGSTLSKLDNPAGIAADVYGNVYIADSGNLVVEKVTPTDQLSIIAGNEVCPYPLPAGPLPATSGSICDPTGVAVDANGYLYVSDWADNVVDQVTPGGTMSVFAGVPGAVGLPTPGPATSSELLHPYGVAVDGSGDVYIADSGHDAIEKVTPGGILSIVAGVPGQPGTPTPGPATASHLDGPLGIALDDAGNLYIADTNNGLIEKVSPSGILSVIADPLSSQPAGLAVDRSGNLYVANVGSDEVVEGFGVAAAAPPAGTNTTVSCYPASVPAGTPTTCTATVRTGVGTPTGSVSFSSSPPTGAFGSSGSCQLAAAALCQITFTPGAPGTYTIVAGYGGSKSYAASTGQTAISAAAGGGGGSGPVAGPVPTVTTGAASPSAGSAIVAGSVDPGGLPVLDCRFDYGLTTAYGASVQCAQTIGSGTLGSGTTPVAVSAALDSLGLNTTYHYRLEATNAAGTSFGQDETFMTGLPPSVSFVDPSISPATGGVRFTITGTGFSGATKVSFGSGCGPFLCVSQTPVGSFTVLSDTAISVSAPASAPGIYHVIVTTPRGASEPSPSSYFFYEAPVKPTSFAVRYAGGPIATNPRVAIVLIGPSWCALPGMCATTDGATPSQTATATDYLDSLQRLVLDDFAPGTPYGSLLSPFYQLSGCTELVTTQFPVWGGCQTTYVGGVSLLRASGSLSGAAIVPTDLCALGGVSSFDWRHYIAPAFGNPSNASTVYLLVYDSPYSCGGGNNIAGSYRYAAINVYGDTEANGTSGGDFAGYQASHELEEAITGAGRVSAPKVQIGWHVSLPGGDGQIADPCNNRDAQGDVGYGDAANGANFPLYNLTRDWLGNLVAAVVTPQSSGCTTGPDAYPSLGATVGSVNGQARAALARSALARSSGSTAAAASAASAASPLRFVKLTLPDAVQGSAYRASVSVTGARAPYAFHVASGQLPPGLTLDQNTGTISGRPAAAGESIVTIQATGGPPTDLSSATASFALLVDARANTPPRVVAFPSDRAPTTGGLIQVSGSGFSTAPGATGFTFGGVPATDVICPTTLSCTMLAPAAAPGTVQVRATVAGHTSPPAHVGYVVPGALAFSDQTLPGAQQGSDYSASLASGASGGQPPYRFALARGKPPRGLRVTRAGQLQGTPVLAGGYSLLVRVRDASGRVSTARAQLLVTIANARLLLLDAQTQTSALLKHTRGARRPLRNAASALQAALRASLWLNDDHLQPAGGRAVFNQSALAIRDLQAAHLHGHGATGARRALIDELVSASSALVQAAIQHAAQHRATRHAHAATKALLAALRLARRRPTAAIARLGSAWQQAAG